MTEPIETMYPPKIEGIAQTRSKTIWQGSVPRRGGKDSRFRFLNIFVVADTPEEASDKFRKVFNTIGYSEEFQFRRLTTYEVE